ncbi:hypothetical protein BHE74_00036555 [Ensete ventricosum]|nr:hypothetical protein BHE74_00036555 [Ensete ventricosum]RZS12454.1 hypothetical protein BHM03_00043895 [Ensete ventricosum]
MMMSEIGEQASMTDTIHEYKGSSSSSDSDNEKPSANVSTKKRLFGRKEPVHVILGGGKLNGNCLQDMSSSKTCKRLFYAAPYVPWFSHNLSFAVVLIVYTAPVLYEKYEDHVDTAAEKAMVQIDKQYAVLNAKVLQKIPGGRLSSIKQH